MMVNSRKLQIFSKEQIKEKEMKKIFLALVLIMALVISFASFGMIVGAINEDEVNEYTAYANNEVSKMTEHDLERTIAYIEQLKADGKLSYAAFAVGNHTGEFFHWTLDGTTDNTLFDMASVTKPVVVTSLFLQAQSEGLLSWDDTLSMHFENVSEDKADIPLWRLLSHSSGFVARVSNSVLSTFENEEDRQAAVVDYILSTNLSYTPGTKVTYACNGYVVLGAILENVYGKSLDQLFLEKVAGPLGMENSGYKLFENATDLAKHQSNSNRVNDDIAHFINDVSGNAGLFSNILDMSVYAIAVANKLADLDVSSDVFDESVKNRTEELGDSRASGWKYVDESYAQTGKLFSTGSIGHTGHTGTSFFVDPETGLWVVLLTNANYLSTSSEVETMRKNFHNILADDLAAGQSNIEVTPYGNIDKSVYPLNDENAVAVFQNNGDGSYTLLKTGTWAVLKDYYYTTVKKEVNLVAYLRCDHTIPVSGKIDPAKISGTVTCDLNGKTLTRSSNSKGHMLDVVANNDCAAYTSNIVLKNGTLNSVSTMIGINNSGLKDGTDVTYTKNLNIDFEKVTFKYGSDSATQSGAFFNCWKNSSSTADNSQIKINLNFDDKCVYDFTVMPADAVMFAVTGSDSTKEADVVANFYGGTVKLANSTFGKVFSVTTSQDTVNVYPGADGKLMKIETNGSSIISSLNSSSTLTASNGKFNYVLDTKSSTSSLLNYYLGTKDEFPFEVFDASGASVGKYATWLEAFAKADDQSGSTIKLLKDAYQITAGSASGNFGTITLDLNGHTLNRASTAYLINTYFANTKAQSTKIIIKNGTMVKASTANKYGFICINYSNAADKNTAVATIDFDISNVTFENEKTDDFIFSLFENGKAKDWTKGTNTTAVFTDCIFKYKGTVFMLENSGADGTKSVINLQINGGQFIAMTDSSVSKLYKKDSLDTVTFGKGSDGKYPVFTVPTGISVPAAEDGWNTTDGVECVQVKVSESNGKVNYTLYPAVMVGYKIKTSVTLYSNFVYNIYIPTANVNGFKVNGIAMKCTTETIDGVEYYVVKVDLPAGETLADIKLCVILNSGNTTVDANWTLNVYNYTKAVLGGNYDDTTKTLMKDMLVYAEAAHTYFENTEAVAAKLAEIKTLLGDYAAEMPIGEAKAPADKTYFTDVAVYLGEVPSFRFYLAEGYTAADFSFKVGNRTVETKASEDGKYVEIVMYAYMMLDDVTFTVKTTGATGTYNLYSYYEYAKTLNNANLTAVVEGLMKYSVSAKAYRNSIVGK